MNNKEIIIRVPSKMSYPIQRPKLASELLSVAIKAATVLAKKYLETPPPNVNNIRNFDNGCVHDYLYLGRWLHAIDDDGRTQWFEKYSCRKCLEIVWQEDSEIIGGCPSRDDVLKILANM